jgi:hypothetical protein
MEQRESQITNSEIAKEAKVKVIEKINKIALEESKLPLMLQALANTDQIKDAVNEIPALKEYLEKGGRISITREWLPRQGRPRHRISLTKEGLVYSRVRKGGNEFPLTGNMIAAQTGHNGAIDALGGLSSKELLERVARGIDSHTITGEGLPHPDHKPEAKPSTEDKHHIDSAAISGQKPKPTRSEEELYVRAMQRHQRIQQLEQEIEKFAEQVTQAVNTLDTVFSPQTLSKDKEQTKPGIRGFLRRLVGRSKSTESSRRK